MRAPLIRTQAVLDDPAVTYWLKGAIRALLDRDPVDAVADAELLAEVMRRECKAVLAGSLADLAAPF